MIGRKRKPPLILLLVVLLLVLLPLLAYKQYDWLGKVSESEREQMQTNMRRVALLFRDAFDSEIMRVNSSFQSSVEGDPDPEHVRQRLHRDYASLYSDWMATAPYPKLVSDMFLVRMFGEDLTEIEKFDAATSQFSTIDWPVELAGLRKTSAVTLFRLGKIVQQRFLAVPSQVDSSIPAVIVSVMEARKMGVGALEIPLPRTTAQVVLKLNLDYIRKEFIPELARHYLSTHEGELDYQFGVIDRNGPGRLIYSSTDAIDVTTKGDVATDIFTPRPADFRAVSISGVTATSDMIEKRTIGSIVQLQVNHSGAGPLGAKATFEQAIPAWQLVMNHRSGSLDVAVAQTRQRNLVISFSILLILAVSVTLILLSAQRERRLAQQQMEFVSAVSHELRTPLAVICSAGENLADGVVRDEQQTRQYGALVRNEGRRLADMVEQVLDFAGIQSGQKTYRLAATEVGTIVDRALETFEMQIRDTGVVVEKRIANDMPLIMADPPALVRAVQNLISNALKYGQAGNWVSVRSEATSESVNIIVQDRGGGISPIDLPHIFEPFYRGRSVVDAQIKGSGLGLSLVRQIVEAHHAKITVDSSADRGSSFVISFPLAGSVANFVSSHDQAYSPR